MKQIKALVAVSLDGFIATLDNELDWITSNVKSLIGKEYEMATCLLMGANTYTYIFNIGVDGRTKASSLLWCPTTTTMLRRIVVWSF